MDQSYVDSLVEQLEIECNQFGEEVIIEDKKFHCLLSQSATTKNLQIAGFYKNKTLDLVIPNKDFNPNLNDIVLVKNETFQIKQIENLEFDSGYRLAIELIK